MEKHKANLEKPININHPSIRQSSILVNKVHTPDQNHLVGLVEQ